MSDAAICLCDGNKPNGQSLCAIPAHRIAYLESELATLKARAEDAERARNDLAAWKESAMQVMAEWDPLRVMVDKHGGRLGHSVATEAARLWNVAETRARRAETLVKYATAFLLRFGKADQWIQIEERMTGAWFWKQWLQPEHGPFADIPSALRALAAAGLLPDELAKVIE